MGTAKATVFRLLPRDFRAATFIKRLEPYLQIGLLNLHLKALHQPSNSSFAIRAFFDFMYAKGFKYY